MKEIYRKLQKVRSSLSKSGIKKSGYNPFSKFYYFSLSDFLNTATIFMEKEGMSSFFHMKDNAATLTIINTDKDAKDDDYVSFVVPRAEATLKGAQPIQNLGAEITYLRRYLYVLAFEIMEDDSVDAHEPINNRNSHKPLKKGDKQRDELLDSIRLSFAESSKPKPKKDDIFKKLCVKFSNRKPPELSVDELVNFKQMFQTALKEE